MLILTSHLNLRLLLAELLLKQVLPSLYWDMRNLGSLPKLQELSMVQLLNLSIFQPFWNSELKGQVSIHGGGLHYFKNLRGNTTVITIGLTQWASSSEAKNTMKHLFMIMTGNTLYFHACHFVRLTKSWLHHQVLGIFSVYRPARLTNLSSKHHFLTFQELGPVSMKSFVFCSKKCILPPLLEGHV